MSTEATRSRASRIVEGVVHFRCSSCESFKPREQFPKEKRSPVGIDSRCKLCKNGQNYPLRTVGNKSDPGLIEYRHAQRHPDIARTREARVKAYAAMVECGKEITFARRHSA